MSTLLITELSQAEIQDARNKYSAQMNMAVKRRNIGWEFTFTEWLQLWLDSGHWYERGRGIGKYCMCRYNDIGSYSKDNIYFDTTKNNSYDGNIGKELAKEHKEKIGAAHKGKVVSEDTKSKMSKAHKGTKVRGKNPKAKKCYVDGVEYDCTVDAAEVLHVLPSKIRDRIKSKNFPAYQYSNTK